MSKFFQSGETVKVSFPDGESIDVKEELSQADTDYIMSKMMQSKIVTKYEEGTPKAKPTTEISMQFGKQATLERAIVSWSFLEDGKPVPVTPENISNLRSKYRTKVLAEIDRLSALSEAFAKN